MRTGHCASFALRVLHRQHFGSSPSEEFFDIQRLHHCESQSHLTQQLLAPRRRAGQNDLRFVCHHKLDYRS